MSSVQVLVTPSLPPRAAAPFSRLRSAISCVAKLHVDVVLGLQEDRKLAVVLSGGLEQQSEGASSHHSSPATPQFSFEHSLALIRAIRRANIAFAVAWN
jgi:hypothetical protein